MSGKDKLIKLCQKYEDKGLDGEDFALAFAELLKTYGWLDEDSEWLVDVILTETGYKSPY